MIASRLRDRDAIATRENMIFRVYGYSHPSEGYICDPEYAPENIFKSIDTKAPRRKGKQTYYKFFADEGLRFVREHYPGYTIWNAPLQSSLVGVRKQEITRARKPENVFEQLIKKAAPDNLVRALQDLSDQIVDRSGLSRSDFGVFGSLLHGFYHPQYSDLDLVTYGKEPLRRLRQMLQEVYRESDSLLRNEFEKEEAVKGKDWKWLNYSPKEFVWHQRRKLIYGLFRHEKSHRVIKTEFEPVKQWAEIQNEYHIGDRVSKQCWMKMIARVVDDSESSFMPSIYEAEPVEILTPDRVDSIQRIVSFVEEYRMQARKDEEVYVEGTLERVVTPGHKFNQVTLSYGPRYYEQVLKVVRSQSGDE